MAEAAVALCLLLLTVLIHVAGLVVQLAYLERVRRHDPLSHGPAYVLRLVVAVILVVILLHVIEVTVWAVGLRGIGAFPDAATALFYSLGSYSTVGSEGVVLPGPWRMLRGVEALVGALMFGLSTAFVFAVMNTINQMWQRHLSARRR